MDEPQLIPLPQVQLITGLSRSEVWRRVANDPAFPKPIRLGERCTRWNKPECVAYVAARLAERKGLAA